MAVTASALTPIETQATPANLWALAFLFKANWAANVITASSWSTDVSVSKSGAEQRRSLIGKPARRSEATFLSLTPPQVLGLQSYLQRAAQSRSLFPLFSDQSLTTSASSGTTINCPTSFRRLSVGSRVAIFSDLGDAFDVRKITAKTSSTITVDANLSTSFATGSKVFPLIEAQLSLDNSIDVITDGTLSAQVSALELPGPWSNDASVTANSIPSGFSSYLGYPILNTKINYARSVGYSIQRTGSHSGSGITQVPDVYGARGVVSLKRPYLFTTRAEWYAFNEFMDSRCGRTFPFWVHSASSDYDVESFTASGLRVRVNGPERDWDYRPYVYMEKTDGSVQVRKINSRTRSAGLDTLVLDSAFTSPTNVLRVGIAYLCRNKSDEVEERWLNDEVCEVDLEVLELINEKSVTLGNIVTDDTDGSTDGFDPEIDSEPPASSGVTVPMFYYPGLLPTERPCDSAASLTLPQKVKIRIRDSFTVDASFPLASGSVSAELQAELPDTYELEYVGPVSGTQRSWHWHHLRVIANASFVPIFAHAFDSNIVIRHLWRATKTYSGAGGTTRTITVEGIVEWDNTVNRTGAAGALFNFYVYSDEINTSYVDGTPFALRGGRAFTKSNPAHYVSNAPWKVGHPQMLLACSVPTSWELPVGNQGERACDDFESAVGTPPVAVVNGAPWIGADEDVCHNNVVFGPTIGSFIYRAMSIGGDCPTSTLFEHLIVENPLGEGITALIPTEPGWDPATGAMELGSATVEIIATDPNQSANSISCCGLYADGGGSNKCWKPDLDECCFSVESELTLRVVQKAVCQYLRYENNNDSETCEIPLGGGCEPRTFCCSASREFKLKVCDVSYFDDGNQTLRSMTWETWWKIDDTGTPTSDYVRVFVIYGSSGFQVYVPTQAMPLTPKETFCPDEGTDCVWPNCCTVILKTLHPPLIDNDETDGYVAPLGDGKPWANFGGPGCNKLCVGCPAPGEDCVLFEDFQAATLSVTQNSDCGCSGCTGTSCSGVEIWYGICGSGV